MYHQKNPDNHQESNLNDLSNRNPGQLKDKTDEPVMNIDPKYELSGSLISLNSENGQYSRQRNQDILRNNLQQQLRGKSNHGRSQVPQVPPPQQHPQQYTQHRTYTDRSSHPRNQAYQKDPQRQHQVLKQSQEQAQQHAQRQQQHQHHQRQVQQHQRQVQQQHQQQHQQQQLHQRHHQQQQPPQQQHQNQQYKQHSRLRQQQPQQHPSSGQRSQQKPIAKQPGHPLSGHISQSQISGQPSARHQEKHQQQNYNGGRLNQTYGQLQPKSNPVPVPVLAAPQKEFPQMPLQNANVYGNHKQGSQEYLPLLTPVVPIHTKQPVIENEQVINTIDANSNPVDAVPKTPIKLSIPLDNTSELTNRLENVALSTPTKDSTTISTPSTSQSIQANNSPYSSKSPNESFTSNPNTSNSNVSATSSGKRKSNPYYETAVHNIEQEKKMVAALKRLSIGQMLNYDPELPMDDIEIHLKQQYDEPSPNMLNIYKREMEEQAELDALQVEQDKNLAIAEPYAEKEVRPENLGDSPRRSKSRKQPGSNEEGDEFFDAEDNKTIFASTNSLLWVPADLHPEVDPELFKAHVKTKVDEISQKLTGNKPGESEDDEFNQHLQRGPSQKSLSRSNSRSSAAQQSKRESTHSQRFSNPSLRELTSELEKLSKSAGMDATDAVTLARTLSTSSLGYTDVERLAFDEISTSAVQASKRTSMNSVDSFESGSDEDDDVYTSIVPGRTKRSSPPMSTTLHLQQQLHKQFQQSQLLREKEYAERELLEREQLEQHEKHLYQQKLAREKRLKDAQQRELEQLEQRRRAKSKNDAPNPISSREELTMQQKIQQQQQQQHDFALKRSRRPDYRKQTQVSSGANLQDSKQGKLTNLRNNLQSKLGDVISQNVPISRNKHRSARDSQLLFNYKKPNEQNEMDKKQRQVSPPSSDSPYPVISQRKIRGESKGSSHSIQQGEELEKRARHSLGKQSKLSTRSNNNMDGLAGLSESPYPTDKRDNVNALSPRLRSKNLTSSQSKDPKPKQLNQNLDVLRSEINQFKESLKTGTDQSSNTLQRPVGTSGEVSPIPSDGNESDFSFELSYQDVSYEDPLGMDQDVLKELGKEQRVGSNRDQSDARVAEQKKKVRELEEKLEILNQQKNRAENDLTSVEGNANTDQQMKLQHSPQQYRHQPQPSENVAVVEENSNHAQQTLDKVVPSTRSSPYPSPTLEEDLEGKALTDAVHNDIKKHEETTIMHDAVPKRMEELVPESNTEPDLTKPIDFDHDTDNIVIDPKPIGPEDLVETSTPKKLMKKKSFGILSGGSTEPKKLKKKKSWGWLRERSSSLSSVDSDNLPPLPDNIKILGRSVSNPENASGDEMSLVSEQGKMSSDSKSSVESINGGQGKENMITKLFKKKRPSDASLIEANLDNGNEKKKMNSGNIFRKKEKGKPETYKQERDIKRNSLSSSENPEPTKHNVIQNERLIDSKQVKSNDKENEVPAIEQKHLYEPMVTTNDQAQAVMPQPDNKMRKLKDKLKADKPKADDEDEVMETEEAIVPDEKPIHTTLDVQEKLKKSIRRTSKANQPIEFTDSAFGFPLPPPSQSTLVMLDYRFPVHVERAIYRLSHLKLANPKRSLREQVLLSNFMYAYLNLVDHTLHLEQQLSEGFQEEQTFDQSEDPTLDEEDVNESIPLELDMADVEHINTTSIDV